MADSAGDRPRKEVINIETFMTKDEIKVKNHQRLRELEVLKSELNSVKKSGKRLFVSSYPENPTGTVLFLSTSKARLRSQVEKDYQSVRKKTNNLEESLSNELNF